MKTIDPNSLSTAELHGYLLGAIAPRPIAFASTIDEQGRPNLAPFSFFNVFSANPPILIFSPARRGRDNTTKHTYENVLKVPEVVINVVSYSLVQQCSLASTEYDEGVNEFVKSGLTELPSEIVQPPRIKESPVQFECVVKEVIELGEEGGAGNLVMAEVVKIHINEEVLNEQGKIDPIAIDLVGRCGGDFYSRCNAQSMFEVPKPIRNKGIGVDQIPEDIRLSKVLTGNDLGMLGNVELLPNETDVNEYKLIELSELFIELEDQQSALEEALHHKAKELLNEGKVEEAWKALLTFNNG
ncbi:MAG: flavin reductase family protein [Bacteroidetes bacterium]|nr:flavin reductase family protein [Bacteroidota bacterium]MDP4586937.1 flavin reductase family protein [Flavobacteriales bacterium]